MSDVNELIKRAEEALKKEESFRPWFVEADAKAVVDGDRYPLDDRSQLHMAIFFENTPALIRELVDALKNAWDFIATDDVSDEATIVAELGERRKEKCGITFLDGDTYVMYAGDVLEAFAKAYEYDEIGRDEKRLAEDE